MIWEPPNTSPLQFVRRGDQPRYAEYHWHGLQLITGNAYVLCALAVFAILLAASVRISRRARVQSHAGNSESAQGEPVSYSA